MPPRKSNVSTTSNAVDNAVPEVTPAKTTKEKDGISVEDLTLPKSMIGRLAKGVLPPNTQIHRDALLALHKSATVFVSYLAANSNDFAQGSGKKTISPQDVMSALKEAELDEFIPKLEAELKKYNDTQCDKRNTYRRKVKEEKAAAAVTNEDSEMLLSGDGGEEAHDAETSAIVNGDHVNGDAAAARPAKKFKRANGESTGREVAAAVDDEEEEEEEEVADDDQEADPSQDDEDEEEEEEEEGDEDDDAASDGDEDEEDEEEDDEGEDEGMNDEEAIRNQLRDEALDEPDSD